MTREEAIDILWNLRPTDTTHLSNVFAAGQAVGMAIQALEAVDKIKAEIQSMSTDYCGGYIGLNKQEVLEIIDKYIGDKNEKR